MLRRSDYRLFSLQFATGHSQKDNTKTHSYKVVLLILISQRTSFFTRRQPKLVNGAATSNFAGQTCLNTLGSRNQTPIAHVRHPLPRTGRVGWDNPPNRHDPCLHSLAKLKHPTARNYKLLTLNSSMAPLCVRNAPTSPGKSFQPQSTSTNSPSLLPG